VLGVLSSRLHGAWALAAGGWLGVGNDPVYAKTRCFEPFPFPEATDEQRQTIRTIAEQLDSHRKRQQALHPELTLTGIYNVLEKLRQMQPPSIPPCQGGGLAPSLDKGRAGEGLVLTPKEKVIHEQGLVSVLRQLHDELDAAVANAYGWPVDLPEEDVLERLVALNAARAREEAQGLVRWIRPEYQQPNEQQQSMLPVTTHLPSPESGGGARQGGGGAKEPWPKTLPEQAAVVRAALNAAGCPVTAETIARSFLRARTATVAELLATLAAIGQAREVEPGSYTV
jgi:hypothetical protein